jgi:hypothetical protein
MNAEYDFKKYRMAWSLFSFSSLDALIASEDGIYLTKELEKHLVKIESAVGMRFPCGMNPHIASVKLNHNPISAYPKPLFFYFVIYIFEVFVQTVFRFLGFHMYEPKSGADSREGYTLTYWKRDPTIKNGTACCPIVFAHGMGGLWCYIYFVYELMRANPTRAIFLVDIRYAG